MASDELLHGIDTVPSVQIQFPLAPTLNGMSITDIDWIQERNRHDLMIIRHSGTDPSLILPYIPAGSPIKVTIRTFRNTRTMYGYIHKAEPEYGFLPRTTRITVVGAGYPMKEAGKTALANASVDMMVRRVARRHRLFADIEPHPRLFKQLVQSGETDWEFLTRLAEESGYSLRMDGVTLRFVSRGALSRHYRTLSPTLRYHKNRGSRLYDVLSFTPTDGAYVDESSGFRAKRRVDYLDKYAATFSAAHAKTPLDVGRKGTDPQYTRFDSRTATSFKEADYIAQASMENNRYQLLAQAELVGNPVICPDMSVFLKGIGSPYNGYWTVLKAHHHIQPTRYTIDVDLGSEGDGPDVHGPVNGPGSRHSSRYALRTPYPAPYLSVSGVKTGTTTIQIPNFFDNGPRWVARSR